ncbi:hypothetical protein [Desulfobulbus oligotrophicus]|uniref:Uncharacterized protein n=1 Tax=Desulfobulbus oligotrophicus TaxID=1909699 RepID=A0A7T6AQE6_9BACT|nr:hypothetical protein [Desulfobulbus oligotrophicus]QQG65482.1 hypothetical protein HP555_06180 [Desulfobulbus oligotrophicus]
MMATINQNRQLQDPIVSIRARIAEKRIFEARFLFRQFGDVIAPQQKQKLADELAAVLTEAEQLLQRARAHVAGGERAQAEQLYQEIEKVVIDMPGVADEARALAGAAVLTLKMRASAPLVPDPEQQFSIDPEPRISNQNHIRFRKPQSKTRAARWLVVCLVAGAGLLTASLLVLWYKNVTDADFSIPFLSRPSEKIQIRPIITADHPAMEQAAPDTVVSGTNGRDDSEMQAAVTLSPSSADTPVSAPAGKVRVHPLSTLEVGTLQVEQSTGQ